MEQTIKRMVASIKAWYGGEIRAFTGEVRGYWIQYHWSARLARWLVTFWLCEWKWIISTLIAVSALFKIFG